MKPARLTTAIYFFTVFCTGAAVLIFEVAAVRLFAPYFGSSLYVLSSVLTVVLLALSLGYFFGGRLADRFPTYLPLYFIIMSSGVIMLLLLNMANYILPASQGVFSLMTGPLLMSALIFFVPALLLGMDSPYIIKLLSKNVSKEQSGAVVGSAFFWSTIGSIVGSISAGFVLIPNIGLTNTISLISFGLVIIGAGLLCILTFLTPTTERETTWSSLSIVITTFIVFGAVLYFNSQPMIVYNQAITSLYQTDGFYSNIHVFEQTIGDTTYRLLKRDTNNSSAIIPGSTTTVFAYAQIADTYKTMKPDAASYLVLGGGGYTIPRQIHHFDESMNISVVELEPKLLDVAYKYFELPDDPRITPYQQDARMFLQSTSTKYDVIFADTMNSGHYIPPHLATTEFFTLMKGHLSPTGVAYINTISGINTTEETLMGSMTATIKEVFPNYQMVAMQGPEYAGIQNIVYVVRHDDQPITLPEHKIITNYFQSSTSTLASLIIDNSTFDFSSQQTFTDNQTKVERLIVKQFATQ